MPRIAWHRRVERLALSACAALGAIVHTGSPVTAQVGTAPPNSYALTNVRIIAAPGRVIERGTVVVRGGRIVAVGAQANVPTDVQRIDLPGHTVYAGLIDAASQLGMPRSQGEQG